MKFQPRKNKRHKRNKKLKKKYDNPFKINDDNKLINFPKKMEIEKPIKLIKELLIVRESKLEKIVARNIMENIPKLFTILNKILAIHKHLQILDIRTSVQWQWSDDNIDHDCYYDEKCFKIGTSRLDRSLNRTPCRVRSYQNIHPIKITSLVDRFKQFYNFIIYLMNDQDSNLKELKIGRVVLTKKQYLKLYKLFHKYGYMKLPNLEIEIYIKTPPNYYSTFMRCELQSEIDELLELNQKYTSFFTNKGLYHYLNQDIHFIIWEQFLILEGFNG